MSRLTEISFKAVGGGGRVSDRVQYTWITREEPTEGECADRQMSAGYHPSGYGFYGIKICKIADGTWQSTWYRSDNCD